VEKLNNKDIRDFYYSPNVNRMTKSRRMRFSGNVARKEEDDGM
jgi:hypothetical protein